MKKSHVVILSLFLVVVTAGVTFFGTIFYNVEIMQGVVLSRKSYQDLVHIRDKYADIEYLEQYIKKHYYKEVSDETLHEGLKAGIFQILGDPYSVFLNEKDYKDILESTSGSFSGIGIYVGANENKQIVVISPIEDTPAFEAGILPQDVIVAVEGVEYGSEDMDVAISKIKGTVGTTVTMTMFRPSTNTTFDVTLKRAVIDIKVVKTEEMGDFGYLRLLAFDEGASGEVKAAMDRFVSQGKKGVVFDLRNNPGGSLDTCVEIADMFLGSGEILHVVTRDGKDEIFHSDASRYEIPVVFLVNGGSASASEILSGAMKDFRRGEIVGETTFGKGVVQSIIPFGREEGVKLTVAEYFTPKKNPVHGIGIVPTVEVKQEAGIVFGGPEDVQLKKALELLGEQHGEKEQ